MRGRRTCFEPSHRIRFGSPVSFPDLESAITDTPKQSRQVNSHAHKRLHASHRFLARQAVRLRLCKSYNSRAGEIPARLPRPLPGGNRRFRNALRQPNHRASLRRPNIPLQPMKFEESVRSVRLRAQIWLRSAKFGFPRSGRMDCSGRSCTGPVMRREANCRPHSTLK